MAEEEDFSKLSLEDKLQHKSWKARQLGYKELGTECCKWDPDTQSHEFRKYSSNIISMAKDCNAPAQETGLECVIKFLENAPQATRLRDDLVPIVVQKGLGSARASNRSRSLDILLMLVEIDAGEPVIELLLPEINNKQPKLVAAVISAIKEIIRLFGGKVINTKPILKHLSKMFGHSDKNVRAEASELAVVMYPWIGKGVDVSIADLKPVQIKELQEKFNALPTTKPTLERILRSHQSVVEEQEEEVMGDEECADDNSLEEEPEDIDPYEFADPVDITSKIPSNFYKDLQAKKWTERKDALEGLLPVINVTRLSDSGPYGELVNVLNSHVNDLNVVVSILAINCLKHIANGLRKKFAAFKPAVLPTLLQKLKEKKQTYVDALRSCLDAIFLSVELSDVIDDILAMFPHKNPQIKAESIRWLIRILKTIKTPPSKSEVKRLCEALLKTFDDGDTAVREATAECIGTLMKAAGERNVNPFIESLADIKKTKVNDYFAKAEVLVQQKAPPKIVPKKAAPAPSRKPAQKSAAAPKKAEEAPKPSLKSASSSKPPPKIAKLPAKVAAKPPVKKAAAGTASKKAAPSKKSKEETISYKFTSEDVDGRIVDFLSADILEEIQNSAWKIRLEAMGKMCDQIESADDLEPELIIRQLAKKPGWKEVNFQVVSKMFGVIQILATRQSKFTAGCAALSIPSLVDKLGDMKLKKASSDALDAIIDCTSLNFVLGQSCPLIAGQKSPKVIGDALIWVKQTINDFGLAGVTVRPIVDFAVALLSSSNATVRSNAVKLLAELRLYVGPEIRTLVQDVNSSLLNIIDLEFAKVADKSPPTPTKGKREVEEATQAAESGGEDMMDDLFPRVDISSQINPPLIALLSSGNWKERKEGLETVAGILEAANNRIKPTIGDLLPALKARLEDKNLNLVVAALDLLGAIAAAVGKPYEKQGRTLVGPICSCINNPKSQNRIAAIGALSKMADQGGLSYLIAPIATSLTLELPLLRKDLLKWLSERLASVKTSPSELNPLTEPLMLCLQDKNLDVRKGAQACLGIVVENIGYASAKEKCSSLKASMQPAVQQVLDSYKTNDVTKEALAKKSTLSVPDSLKGGSRSAPNTGTPGSPNDPSQLKRSNTLARKPASTRPITPKMDAPIENTLPILTNDPSQKENRLSKERASRWVFEIPPSDLIDNLADTCAHHFASELHKLMFSTGTFRERDFTTVLTELEKSLISADDFLKQRFLSVSDLLIRYITIHFYDQGLTILIKSLDLLQLLVKLMEEHEVSLSDAEASILFPSLVGRLGINNETLKKRVKDILRQIGHIHPNTSIFILLLDCGLKSKNARTRTETLDELGHLLQRFGLSVCLSPSKSLATIATHIGDRDAGVRNSAITAILQAYIQIGEKVYKYLGTLPERDRGYLEERFKRTKTLASPLPPPKLALQNDSDTHIFSFQKNTEKTYQAISSELSRSATPSPIKRPSPPPQTWRRRTPSPINIPSIPSDLPFSPKFPQESSSNSGFKSFDLSPEIQAITDRLETHQPSLILDALRELEKMMTGSIDLLIPYANILLNSVCDAFSNLDEKIKVTDHVFSVCIRTLILTFLRLFESASLTQAFSADSLRLTLHSVISCLLDHKIRDFPAVNELSRHLNVLLVRVLANSHLNSIYEAIFDLMNKCISKDYSQLLLKDPEAASLHTRYSNLVMKCSWKLARRIVPSLSHEELDISRLLQTINDFFNQFPPKSLSQMSNQNNPIAGILSKTLKTTLYWMCDVLGQNIYKDLDLLNFNQCKDYLTPLVHRMLNKIENRTKPSSKRQPDSNEDLAERLQEIMSLVDSSDTNREGIRALFEFEQQYPNYRPIIEENLERRGSQFNSFIQRSLANLRRTASHSVPETSRTLDSHKSLESSNPKNSLEESKLTSEQNVFAKSPTEKPYLPTEPEQTFPTRLTQLRNRGDSPDNSRGFNFDLPQNIDRSVATPSPPSSRQRTVGDLRARLAQLRMSNSGLPRPSDSDI